MADVAAEAASHLFGASVRGAAHIRHGKPNQDAMLGLAIGHWSFLAVADGHGHARYDRSERGAGFAVKAASQAIRELTGGGTAGADEIRALGVGLTQLPGRIVTLWRAAVEVDIAADPPPASDIDTYARYGSTLAVAVVGAGLALYAQIGDGDIVAFTPDGTPHKPLADDIGLIGEQTYSISQPDAADHFRCSLHGAPSPLSTPDFVLAATDGLSKSFDGEAQFLKVACQWQTYVAGHGLARVAQGLEPWLGDVSHRGTGDDVTVMLYQGP